MLARLIVGIVCASVSIAAVAPVVAGDDAVGPVPMVPPLVDPASFLPRLPGLPVADGVDPFAAYVGPLAGRAIAPVQRAAGLGETLAYYYGDLGTFDVGKGMAFDHDLIPNPVVAGWYYPPGTGDYCDGVIVKFDGEGNLAYQAGIDVGPCDELDGVAMDAGNNVVAAGHTMLDDGFHMLAAKVDSDGDLLWTRVIPTLSPITVSNDVALDSQGNAILAGRSGTSSPEDLEVALAKLDGDGNLLWSKTIDLQAPASAESVDVDADDNILVGGFILEPGTDHVDPLVLKLDPEGNVLAAKVVEMGSDAVAYGIAVDGESVLIAGYIAQGNARALLARLTPDLSTDWAIGLVGSTNTVAYDVAVDADGNAVVGGSDLASETYVAKVTRDGVVLFSRLVQDLRVEVGELPFGGGQGFGVATSRDGLFVGVSGYAYENDGGLDIFAAKGLGVGALGAIGGVENNALNAEILLP